LISVETDGSGQPTAFSDHVVSALTAGQIGHQAITENARRVRYHDGLLVWTPVNSSHYYYAPVTGMLASPFNITLSRTHSETTDTELVHRAVCLFTSQLLLVLIALTHRRMARLS